MFLLQITKLIGRYLLNKMARGMLVIGKLHDLSICTHCLYIIAFSKAGILYTIDMYAPGIVTMFYVTLLIFAFTQYVHILKQGENGLLFDL